MSLWRIDQRHVRLGFWGDSPRANLGFDEPGVCSACVMLLHTCQSWNNTYWRCGVVLLHTCHLWSGTYKRHGSVLLHTCHSWRSTYWRRGGVLLRTCHSWRHDVFRELIRELFILGFGETRQGQNLGLTSLVHMSCSCIPVIHGVARIGDGVHKPVGLTKGGPLILWSLWKMTNDPFILDFGKTHQGWTLGLTSMWSCNHGCTCLEDTRKLWKWRDAEFYSMYLIEYKFPLLS